MVERRATTNLEVLQAVSEIAAKLARVEAEMNAQHQEKMDELVEIKEQVKYTNGQVKALKQWKSNVEAVDRYKAEQASQPMMGVKVETNNAWDWKVVLAIILTLATAVAAVAGVTSK